MIIKTLSVSEREREVWRWRQTHRWTDRNSLIGKDIVLQLLANRQTVVKKKING